MAWDVWFRDEDELIFGEIVPVGWYVDIPQPRVRGGERSTIELGPYPTEDAAKVIARATV